MCDAVDRPTRLQRIILNNLLHFSANSNIGMVRDYKHSLRSHVMLLVSPHRLPALPTVLDAGYC